MITIYLILVHKCPPQLARLINSLDNLDAHFVVHVDQKVEEDVFFQFIKLAKNNIHFLHERSASSWGSYQLVQATLDGLKYINDHYHSSDRVVLLSGQDYPIKPLNFIDQYYKSNPNAIYIEHSKVPFENWKNGGIGRFPVFERISKELNIYGGSQWISFPVHAISVILNFLAINPEYEEYYTYVSIPDESFFQTIFLNCEEAIILKNLQNHNLHLINWTRGSPHPSILKKEDLTSIFKSSALFARKFDWETSLNLVNLIDQEILNQGKAILSRRDKISLAKVGTQQS